MSSSNQSLAIVTQDPTNRGGVLRLVEYIYKRAEAIGLAPTLMHYARFEQHPELHASLINLLRGEFNLLPRSEQYIFQGMRALAVGARFPELERNRIHTNTLWRSNFNKFHRFFLVTGSAQTGLPLTQSGKDFASWVSSTVESDRSERLQHTRNLGVFFEKRELPIIRRSEARVLNSSRRILAVSEDAREHLSAITKNSVEVWPYPVDTSHFHPKEMGEYRKLPRFLFVGRANDPRKRVDLFFQACCEFHDRWPEINFIATVVSAEKQSANIDPSIKIEYRENISDRELIDLYSMSTAFILTSEQEGLGIAAMEAMACGLPVISTRCGGPETFIVDNETGFFVKDNPSELAERMHELASNEMLRTHFRKASSARIEHDFSERRWNPKFDELLKELNTSFE